MGAVMVTHWGRNGGGPRFTAELARALAGRRDDVVVQHHRDAEAARDLATAGAAAEQVRTYGTTARSVPLALWRLPLNALRTRRAVRRHGVTHVVSAMEGPFQSLVVPTSLPRHVRYVTVVHDAAEHPGDEHLLKRVGRRLELARADVVVTLSADVTARLVASGQVDPQRVLTLFHPASGAPSAPRPAPSGTVRVGFVGRLLPYKGLDLLVEAAVIAHRRRPELRFEVWGDGPSADARELPGAEHVRWHVGWVPESRLEATVAALDVVVLPYVEASQSGVVALAAAAGVPCVATPVGGLGDQVRGHGGVLADRVDAAAVAEAVLQVADRPELYEELSRQGVKSAAGDRSWDVLAERLEDVLR
ncbi:glycosyltransferase family 4 protein [Puerhibacterium sp. TATVAM-FAB25]|uniref:glycosyltransferase family 4 protein n=1 Tax=Puerhibacterium sp. TATVAM-FAB25 TaxID=3093699 RepID=UPI00397DB9B6